MTLDTAKASPSYITWYVRRVVASSFIVLGIVLIALLFTVPRPPFRTQHWSRTAGEITYAAVSACSGNKEKYNVIYSYYVNGKMYRGDGLGYAEAGISLSPCMYRQVIKIDQMHWVVGPTTVWYVIENPSHSTLFSMDKATHGLRALLVYWLVGVVGIIFLAIGGLIVRRSGRPPTRTTNRI